MNKSTLLTYSAGMILQDQYNSDDDGICYITYMLKINLLFNVIKAASPKIPIYIFDIMMLSSQCKQILDCTKKICIMMLSSG